MLLALVSFVVLAVLTPAHACRRGGSVVPELLGAALVGLVLAAIPNRRIFRRGQNGVSQSLFYPGGQPDLPATVVTNQKAK
jgi:hypothetical protein